jgi:hypothetical protein
MNLGQNLLEKNLIFSILKLGLGTTLIENVKNYHIYYQPFHQFIFMMSDSVILSIEDRVTLHHDAWQ